MKTKGIAVIINSREEFEKIKSLLCGLMYLYWHEAYVSIPTAIIISSFKKKKTGCIGSIGCAVYIKNEGFNIIDFNDYFKI